MPEPNIPFILIVGRSGSGKTTSLRNLDRNTTALINTEEKGLPFKGDFKHHFHPVLVEGHDPGADLDVAAVLKNTNLGIISAIKNPEVDLIAVDSFYKWTGFVLTQQRQTQRGYDIYGGHNEIVKKALNRWKLCRKPMVWLTIDDTIAMQEPEAEIERFGRCAKVYGKELAGSIEQEFTIVLFTETVRQANGTLKYYFRVHGDGICTAKTPMGMFKEPLIDNDLQAVLERVYEFYSETEKEKKKK